MQHSDGEAMTADPDYEGHSNATMRLIRTHDVLVVAVLV